ncbi:MAG: response regulator, partial [Bdellovibrionota bacterium]
MPDFRFKVLLVEDDSELRDLLAGFLKPAYQVIEAESVEMAMDRIAEDSPHILVTDIRMPGESGLSLLREVRARQSDLPVILITGETDRKIAIEGLKLGAFDFIEKPFEIEELLNALVRAAGL